MEPRTILAAKFDEPNKNRFTSLGQGADNEEWTQ
jgi:hypothetical protein